MRAVNHTLCVDGAFWAVGQASWEPKQEAAVAGGGRLAVWASAEELSTPQARAGQARDPARNWVSFPRSLAGTRLVRSREYGVHRTSQSHDPAWGGGAGPPYVGNGPASSASGSPLTLVARLLPLCAATRLAARGRGPRTSGRSFAEETAVQTTHASYGGWADDAPVDRWTPPQVLLATAPRLSRRESRKPGASWSWEGSRLAKRPPMEHSLGQVFKDGDKKESHKPFF